MSKAMPDDKPAPRATAAREARLAQALRDNLRRRKRAADTPQNKEKD